MAYEACIDTHPNFKDTRGRDAFASTEYCDQKALIRPLRFEEWIAYMKPYVKGGRLSVIQHATTLEKGCATASLDKL